MRFVTLRINSEHMGLFSVGLSYAIMPPTMPTDSMYSPCNCINAGWAKNCTVLLIHLSDATV